MSKKKSGPGSDVAALAASGGATKGEAPLTAAEAAEMSKAVPVVDAPTVADADPKVNGTGARENEFVKELQKTVRGISKRLTAIQKVESVVADNPGASLAELVAARKINADQKAQLEKKAALQAQLAQAEEQIAQYRRFEETLAAQLARDRAELEAAHKAELVAASAQVRAEAREEAEREARGRLLTLSKFLRAAAARRQVEDDASDESRAFEGVLLLLYGGDAAAVEAAERLIKGADEGVTSTDEVVLDVTYARIKELSEAYAPFAAEEAWRQEVADAEQADVPLVAADTPKIVATDPTIAHAGLTEIDSQTQTHLPVTTAAAEDPPFLPPEQTDIDAGAANDTAASSWDSVAQAPQDMSESWVAVSADGDKDAAASLSTLGAAGATGQNWADDQADTAALPADTPVASSTPPNDGFHEVHHHRGSRGRADMRGGRGSRGSYNGGSSRGRGGGYRGDYRGERGRGRGGSGARGRGRDGATT